MASHHEQRVACCYSHISICIMSDEGAETNPTSRSIPKVRLFSFYASAVWVTPLLHGDCYDQVHGSRFRRQQPIS